jgi:hypothetical protein
MKKNYFFLAGFLFISFAALAQYDVNFVETSVTVFEGDKIGVIDMSKEQNHIKIKYFAAKGYNGKSVYDRYQQWARSKNVIAYSSGTYMAGTIGDCDPSRLSPVGICIDNGSLVNNTLTDDFDGMAIVYNTGGIVVSNLKEKNLTVKGKDGKVKSLNIRDAFEKNIFVNWAKENEATVFQSHLFYYNDNFLVSAEKSKKRPDFRRFLAAGYDENKILHNYILNIKAKYDIFTGTKKAVEFLKKVKEVNNLIFIINLDTGCQDVFHTNKADGSLDIRREFTGELPIERAANLIAYYYE